MFRVFFRLDISCHAADSVFTNGSSDQLPELRQPQKVTLALSFPNSQSQAMKNWEDYNQERH